MSTLKEICKEQTEMIDEMRQNIKELTGENEKLKEEVEHLNGIIKDEENRNLLSEISQHIGNKPSSSTYKYFRAKFDGIGIKVGE